MKHIAWGPVTLLLPTGMFLEAFSEAPSAHGEPGLVSVSVWDGCGGLGRTGACVGAASGAAELGVVVGSGAVVKLTTYQ